MPFQITTTVTCYLLPDDGQAAEQDLLAHLSDPSEFYIIAYAFTLPQMIGILLEHFQAGDPVHIYLDYSQSKTRAEKPEIKRLLEAGVEVTIGTSPLGSSLICHTKGMTCLDTPPWCWEGSVNFSIGGWKQVNTAMVFRSADWAKNFVNQFKGLRKFAWTNERNLQLMKAPPKGL